MDRMALSFWILMGLIWGYICWMMDWLGSHTLVTILDNLLLTYVGVKLTNMLPGAMLWCGIGAFAGFLITLFVSAGSQKF